MGHKRMDLIGRRFGMLEVVAFVGLDARRNSRWLCRCDCGQERTHSGSNLKRGNIVSCGCRKHGPKVERLAESHPDFRLFSGMLSRCYNSASRHYPRYGGRGITVCDRWRAGGFWVFNSDMGDRPSAGHSIDRIDNDGPYSPDNCRWATAKVQGRNRCTNTLLTCDGLTLSMSEWAERTGVNYHTLKARVRSGWAVADAVRPEPTPHGITDEQVATIRRFRSDGLTMRAVAEMCGVSIATVHKVCGGRSVAAGQTHEAACPTCRRSAVDPTRGTGEVTTSDPPHPRDGIPRASIKRCPGCNGTGRVRVPGLPPLTGVTG